MQNHNILSPVNPRRRLCQDLLRSTVRAKNIPINFKMLFDKYFIKGENQINLKKYLVELYHDLSHFSLKEENGVSYETFIYFLNMPYPIASNIFKLLDKDKNNYLNIEEFVLGLYDVYGTNSFQKLSNFVFNLYDTDRNGLVSKEDMHLILSYIPLDRNLRNKFLNRDYYNINYNEITKNQKMIERTLNNIYRNRNFLSLENFIFTIQKTCSDIFVAILIYLYESRPFNNDVLQIYSNTDYDYFSENKNYQNFKNIKQLFEKNHKEKKMSVINSEFNIFQNDFIEEPTIDYIKDLNIIKNKTRSEQKKYTFAKHAISEEKKNKSNRHLSLINEKEKTKKKQRGSSFLPEINIPRASLNYKRMSSGFVFDYKYIDANEQSLLHISDMLKLNSIYESTVFKITNKGKLKMYYLKLIKNDLFYFKSKDNKFHTGMHHLTNNTTLIKNKKQKYKSITFYSLSIVNQHEKHTFYFDKEDIYILWYKHLQKSILFRNIEDIFILGEKIKSDKMQTLRNIEFKEEMSNYYHMQNNGIIDEQKKLICTQISKAGKNYQKKVNESIFNQISSYTICYHKNFAKLIDIFQDEKYFYIITEKTSDINILQYIRKLDIHNPLKEEQKICEMIHQILIAIYYLHKMGIIHRNIKPDNLVPYIQSKSQNESYSSKSSKSNSDSNNSSSISKSSKTDNNINDSNKFSNIKLIDLSLSKFLNINETIKEPYGTVGYISPEMLLDQSYDFKIDEWSIGIMTYLLLCGKLPFSDEYSEREIARQTIHEKQSFDQPKWEKISKEAKDFINKLLIKDPEKRMKVKNALVHPWIKKYYPQIVKKRMKNINDNTTCDEGYEFESFSSPIDNVKDLII